MRSSSTFCGPASHGLLIGRRAIITGASRGIGAAILQAFLREGCAVVFCHHDDDVRADELCREAASSGQVAYAIACDVSEEVAVGTFFAEARHLLGGVDILVNNAGIGGEALFEAISPALFDRMLAVHLRGTFLMTRACYADMKEQRDGRIINIASQLAYLGAAGAVHYCAAKAGIVGFTRALAREAAPHGILVNAIAPGPVETELLAKMSPAWRERKQKELPIGRFGKVEDIAPTALLLASSQGAFYVGQTLSPNGGDVML